MIEKERIESIKNSIDLQNYISKSTGCTFKKNGKGFVCRCPFPDHEDKTPSFTLSPHDNLFKCFGCNRGGDIFKFDQFYFGLDFKESFKKHDNGNSIPKTTTKKQIIEEPKSLTVKEQKLLIRVITYYQHIFTKNTLGLDYLKNDRGINDNQTLTDFGTGYVDGTLKNIIPDDEEVIKSLKKNGILNSKGKEFFYNCVVFPLYDANGGIVGMYGRNIDDDCDVRHLYLPGKRRGLVNRQAVKRSQSILLTESIIDALTLYDQGFKNVMPIYGTNGLIDDHLSFFKGKIKEAYLVFDADEAGNKAFESVSMRLKEIDVISYPVNLPVKDVNIYFKRHTPEEFETLLKTANPKSLEQSESVCKRQQNFYKDTEHGFMVGYGERYYEIKGIQRHETQLKVAVKASKDMEGKGLFELTTIDLYSLRSRTFFAKACVDLFEATEELIKEDLGKILHLVEEHKPRDMDKKEEIEPTEAEKEEALKFLKNPKMFEELLIDLEIVGVVGEETNKIVCFLCAVSRNLSKPLSVLIQSRSGAGKSTVQNSILIIIPAEYYEKYTRITDQALFYKEEDSLEHKILAIEEESGVKGAAYSIRNIQSSGVITVATTGKDPKTGKMKTEKYTVKGPVAVMLTTTDPELDQETASRFIHLSIDESSQNTSAIHVKQRVARSLKGLIDFKKAKKVINKHKVAQRMLKPIAVVNNFDQYLTYPVDNLITRRDHEKYLGLIESIAFCHQYQREHKTIEIEGEVIEYIEVELEDIDKANAIANEVLGQSMDELAKPSRLLLSLIYKMVEELAAQQDISIEEVYFNRRMIREYTKWSDWQIKVHIKQLEELEYLYVRVGSKGKEYSYALNYKGQDENGGKFYLNLTTIVEIKKKMGKD